MKQTTINKDKNIIINMKPVMKELSENTKEIETHKSETKEMELWVYNKLRTFNV